MVGTTNVHLVCILDSYLEINEKRKVTLTTSNYQSICDVLPKFSSLVIDHFNSDLNWGTHCQKAVV